MRRTDLFMGDTFYRVQREYRRLSGKSPWHKGKILVYRYLEAIIPAAWLDPLEKILVLSGQAHKRRALDVLLAQAGMLVAVVALGLWAKKTPPLFLVIYGGLVMAVPWRRWIKRIQTRRMEAAMQIRALKRRFVSLLRRKVPLEEALWQLARDAAAQKTDFGRRFMARMKETRTRALGDALGDLAEEFRVPELTRFLQAVRHADQTSVQALAEVIETQARDETARLDEFVEVQKIALQLKMRGMAALSFIYVIGWSGYFAFLVIQQYIQSGHGLFGF